MVLVAGMQRGVDALHTYNHAPFELPRRTVPAHLRQPIVHEHTFARLPYSPLPQFTMYSLCRSLVSSLPFESERWSQN